MAQTLLIWSMVCFHQNTDKLQARVEKKKADYGDRRVKCRKHMGPESGSPPSCEPLRRVCSGCQSRMWKLCAPEPQNKQNRDFMGKPETITWSTVASDAPAAPGGPDAAPRRPRRPQNTNPLSYCQTTQTVKCVHIRVAVKWRLFPSTLISYQEHHWVNIGLNLFSR